MKPASPFKPRVATSENDERVGLLSSYGTRGLLLAGSLIATAIATMILFAPNAFYAGYGIEIAIGGICLVDLIRHRKTTGARRFAAEGVWHAITDEDAA